jgi:haloalkane dehalogenase
LEALRTPDTAFVNLPEYDYAPHYIADLPGFDDLRLHMVDEGEGSVALCLHGQPSWGFLYRKMIPAFRKAGMRVVVPDLFGFGRSDKPVAEETYTFNFHRNTLLRLIEHLNLRRITLVCQDWGGLLGLTLPMDMPDRFDRLIVMNTGLGTGDADLGKGFLAWRAFNRTQPDLDVAGLMRRAIPGLPDAEAAGYAAPFPDARYKAGVRRFPDLVPDQPDAEGAAVSRAARDFWRDRWSGQSFMAVGMKDPVLGPAAMNALRKIIRGCPPPLELPEAGHFVQEAGAVIVERALESFAIT